MKRIAFVQALLVCCPLVVGTAGKQGSTNSKDSFYVLSPVEVKAIRAEENAPFTKTNLSKREVAKLNLGQDIPFLLNQTPSVVINSDAGNGVVSYTGIRIRGTDATRVNVTLNGIPFNDAESLGTFLLTFRIFLLLSAAYRSRGGVGTSSMERAPLEAVSISALMRPIRKLMWS